MKHKVNIRIQGWKEVEDTNDSKKDDKATKQRAQPHTSCHDDLSGDRLLAHKLVLEPLQLLHPALFSVRAIVMLRETMLRVGGQSVSKGHTTQFRQDGAAHLAAEG